MNYRIRKRCIASRIDGYEILEIVVFEFMIWYFNDTYEHRQSEIKATVMNREQIDLNPVFAPCCKWMMWQQYELHDNCSCKPK